MKSVYSRITGTGRFLMVSCVVAVFCLLPVGSGNLFAQTPETPSAGVILGSFGKIKCSRNPQGRLKVQSTKSGKFISAKRARLIQKKNKAVMRNLIRTLNKIQPAKGMTPAEQQEATFDQLPEKKQLKYLRLENRLLKLQLQVNQVDSDTIISDLVLEIRRLKEELKELKQGNAQSKQEIRQCRGCDDGTVENVDRSLRSMDSSFVPRTRAQSCSCFTTVIDASFKFKELNYTGDSSRCTAASLIQWNSQDDEAASDWKVSYFIGPNEHVDYPVPPFNDTLVYTVEEGVSASFSADGGMHQHLVAVGGADAPDHLVADCSQQLENQMSGLSNPIVEVTFCPGS